VTTLAPGAPRPSIEAQPEEFTCPACGLAFPFAVPVNQVAFLRETVRERRRDPERADRDEAE
jgi:hypothetical protein